MIRNWISSRQILLRKQETLWLRNIRAGYLQYFFAFPLAMILINIQQHIWAGDTPIYGFPATTVLFLIFAVSAGGTLIFITPKSITALSKVSAALAVAGLFPWLFLRPGVPALVCASIFMAGLGGCLSSGSLSFVFFLNNAERFWGSAFMLLLIGLVNLGASLVLSNPFFRKSLAVLLTTGLCACMLLSRTEDCAKGAKAPPKRFEPSIYLALFIVFSYFAIRILNFHIPAFEQQSATEAWGVLTLLPVLLCILLQAGFKYSIWTMCNVFFITSITSYALWYAGLPKAAYLFARMDDVGLFVSFYLIGSVTNKFCSFRTHKLLMLLCMAMIGILFVISDLLARTAFVHIVAVVVCATLFALFLLLSPAFSRHLFFSDWSEEFRKLHMTDSIHKAEQKDPPGKLHPPSLDDTNLSFREKQVVLLLLRGLTLRQVAPELGITFSTVSTYSKTIYRKLGINSRAELFLLFGQQTDHSL